MPRPNSPLCDCAPDSEWHEYDVWLERDDGSLEGSGDGDEY